ncbi:MAG TPA: MAE_28990/MAE_18760 family HEPN-like nuclease [Polyangia bacterium]|nr:MAE_28990/MAE_18760 family HEPN-like nuclease [Polyangia bacterium]
MFSLREFRPPTHRLTPTVLQKLLYRLGFDPGALSPFYDDMSLLVGHRHAIAHGRKRDGIDEVTYQRVRRATYAVMEGVKGLIFTGVVKKAYLRSA